MLIIFVRCIIIYFTLLITMRLMGKRQLGELQPFEFVVTLIIADIASIPMQDTSIPLLHGIIPVTTIFMLHLFISKLNFKSIKLRKIIDGKPTIIVDENGINFDNMKSLNMHINDLMEALRVQGYFSLKDVHIAIIETNGSLSVMPKFNSKPLTTSDVKLSGEDDCLPFSIILEGKIMFDTLKRFNKLSKNELCSILKEYKLKVKDIYLLAIDNNGEMYLQPYKEKAIIRMVNL